MKKELIAALMVCGVCRAEVPKPNIVLIVVDDLGWADVQALPEAKCPYRTPNIQKLAQQGMVFSDAYAACPVCSPTRAALMTGKSPAALRLTAHIPGNVAYSKTRIPVDAKKQPAETGEFLPLEEVTFAELLKSDGYDTAFFGKWHLAGINANVNRETCGAVAPQYHPDCQGFDLSIGGCAYGMPRSYFSPYQNATLPDGPAGEYLTDRLTDEAIAFVKQKHEHPFLLSLNYYSVHIPLQPRPDLVDESYGERADYAAMIACVDENIGRLMNVLEGSDTLVILTSDNGGLFGNGPLHGDKGELWEGGIRIPQLAVWQNIISPGTICREPVSSVDILPTLLAAAQSSQKLPSDVEGVSLLPLLKQEPGFERKDPLFWHYPHFHHDGGPMGSAIRDGNLKLIFSYETGEAQLFDLENDLSETQDLSARFPERAELLKKKLFQWLEHVNAAMPTEAERNEP